MKKWMLGIGTLVTVLAGSIFAQDIAGDRQRDESPHSVQFVTVDGDVKLEVLNWGGSGRPLAGCLIGQCLGDALGFIVEGQPTTACSSYVDDVVRTGNVRQLGRGRYPFGQYSDDSQLARELVLSIVDRGKFDAVDYADRIAALFREDRIVGRGLATQAAADRLIRGIPWNEAGAPPPSAGNGSAMRAGPVGLFCFGYSDDLVRTAHDQGRITQGSALLGGRNRDCWRCRLESPRENPACRGLCYATLRFGRTV
jgi:hypothetical protein